MRAALEEAQACDPNDDEDAVCLGSVPGECCPELVNDPDSEAAQRYLELHALAQKLCPPTVCPAVVCLMPKRGHCESLADGAGRCAGGRSPIPSRR